jgi:hypothetical protein
MPPPIPEPTPAPSHSHTPDVVDISIIPDNSDNDDDSKTLPLPLALPHKTPEPYIPDLSQIIDFPPPNPPALSRTPSPTIPKKEEEEPALLTERQWEKQPEHQATPDLPLKCLVLQRTQRSFIPRHDPKNVATDREMTANPDTGRG